MDKLIIFSPEAIDSLFGGRTPLHSAIDSGNEHFYCKF